MPIAPHVLRDAYLQQLLLDHDVFNLESLVAQGLPLPLNPNLVARRLLASRLGRSARESVKVVGKGHWLVGIYSGGKPHDSLLHTPKNMAFWGKHALESSRFS